MTNRTNRTVPLPEGFLTIVAAAEATGLSYGTVIARIKDGTLPGYTFEADRRRLMVKASDVDALLAPQRVETQRTA